ncbi:MAG: YncE family protein, partial [Streptosporangiaceae bacterium]
MSILQRAASLAAVTALPATAALLPAPAPALAGTAAAPRHPTAYVANRGSRTVSPISTATSRSGGLIHVGRGPQTIAITPDYARAYVANDTSDTVTPIVTATGAPLKPITVGRFP